VRYIMKAHTPTRHRMEFDRLTDALFAQQGDHRTPAVDVKEMPDRYILEAELPGIVQKDIEVRIENTLLTIAAAGDSPADPATRNGKVTWLLRERRPVIVNRSFALPGDVDRDAVSASFRDGVLTLVLEKRPEARPRSIPVDG
jgi:HSP20 family protein